MIAINGAATRYMPLKKAVELIRKLNSEYVKLKIRRKAIIWRIN